MIATCGMMRQVIVPAGVLELTMADLRAVVSFAAECAEPSLVTFESRVPHDLRPRAAIDAAWIFARGAARTNLQRAAAVAAHRAAKEAGDDIALLAARAAGDAAAAAYLHPISKSTQVGHILRAGACAARIAELTAGGDRSAAEAWIEETCRHATPAVVDVLLLYPLAPVGGTRLAQLMSMLDGCLRETATDHRS